MLHAQVGCPFSPIVSGVWHEEVCVCVYIYYFALSSRVLDDCPSPPPRFTTNVCSAYETSVSSGPRCPSRVEPYVVSLTKKRQEEGKVFFIDVNALEACTSASCYL